MQQLPLNGRNFLQLGLLSGVALPNSGPSNNTVSQTGHPSQSINVAGNEPDYMTYLVNGISTVGSRANNTSLNLSVDAIDQFEVHYGFFMPDLSASPAVVDVVTKTGTNKFHGGIYEYVRTNQMEAKDYFSTTPPGPYHQNQFGGTLGGFLWQLRRIPAEPACVLERVRTDSGDVQRGFFGALNPDL